MRRTITTYAGLEEAYRARYDLTIVVSEPGLGKSHTGRRMLADAARLTGHVTPLGLYRFVHTNKEKHIWLDDIKGMAGNTDIRNILAQLCEIGEAKTIMWISSARLPEGLPEKFNATATILITTNAMGSLDAAMLSRAHTILFQPTPEEVFEQCKKAVKDTDVLRFVQATGDGGRYSVRDIQKLAQQKKAGEGDWQETFLRHAGREDLLRVKRLWEGLQQRSVRALATEAGIPRETARTRIHQLQLIKR